MIANTSVRQGHRVTVSQGWWVLTVDYSSILIVIFNVGFDHH